ncbi:hypothetical protein DXG01_016927 [Tephrocybe rancida]|nr:hypothetical protein DXG01_016927 [Tephrocybe rancida]
MSSPPAPTAPQAPATSATAPLLLSVGMGTGVVPAPARHIPLLAPATPTPSANSVEEYTAPAPQTPPPPVTPMTVPGPRLALPGPRSVSVPPRDEAMDVDPPVAVEGLAEPHGNPVVAPADPPARVRVPGTPQGDAVPRPAPAAPLIAAHTNPFSPPPLPLADLLQQHRNLTTQRLTLQTCHAALRTCLTQLTQVEEEKRSCGMRYRVWRVT